MAWPQPKSTNPFDSSSSSSENNDDASGDNFFDCHDQAITQANTRQQQGQQRTERSAPLDFDNPFDDVGKN
jgi:hypothetical protein